MSVFDELVGALEPALRSVAPFTATRLVLRARVYNREHMSVSQLAGIRPQLADGLGEVLSAQNCRYPRPDRYYHRARGQRGAARVGFFRTASMADV